MLQRDFKSTTETVSLQEQQQLHGEISETRVEFKTLHSLRHYTWAQ